MSGLAAGWVSAKASDACALVQSGGTPKAGFTSEPGVPFLKVYNLVDQRVDFDYRPQFVSELVHCGELGKSIAYPDDVLMNIVGPPLGKVAVVPPSFPEWNLNQALTVFRPSEVVESKWLYYFLCGGESVLSVINETRGSAGQVNISLSQCRAFDIPIPPPAEQRRIVAKLDVLTARTARARADLDRIPALAARYKQAVLAKAFSGELTAVAAPWPTKAVGDVLDRVVGGKNLRCEERPPRADELGVVKVSAVSWGAFNPRASKTLPTAFSPPAHTRISRGDFLISRANTLELVGAVVVVDQAPDNLFLSDKVLRLEMPDERKHWTMWFLRSPEGRAAIEAGSSGNQLSMRNLSQDALRKIEMPWPDRDIQREIVGRIERAFAEIDRLTADATAALRLLDRLDQAVLAKAFRGELVAQDPADEPATVLLDRIRTERAAAPPAGRHRKAKA